MWQGKANSDGPELDDPWVAQLRQAVSARADKDAERARRLATSAALPVFRLCRDPGGAAPADRAEFLDLREVNYEWPRHIYTAKRWGFALDYALGYVLERDLPAQRSMPVGTAWAGWCPSRLQARARAAAYGMVFFWGGTCCEVALWREDEASLVFSLDGQVIGRLQSRSPLTDWNRWDFRWPFARWRNRDREPVLLLGDKPWGKVNMYWSWRAASDATVLLSLLDRDTVAPIPLKRPSATWRYRGQPDRVVRVTPPEHALDDLECLLCFLLGFSLRTLFFSARDFQSSGG